MSLGIRPPTKQIQPIQKAVQGIAALATIAVEGEVTIKRK